MSIAAIVEALVATGATPEMILAAVKAAEASDARVANRTARQERNARYYQNHKDRLKASEQDGERLNRLNSDGKRLKASDSDAKEKGTQRENTSSLRSEVSSYGQRARASAEIVQLEVADPRSPEWEPWPADAFAEFWKAYPLKVGKQDAIKAFAKVFGRRDLSLADLIAGIERYRRHKPPDREWCHAATWLNGKRWEDELEDHQIGTAQAKASGAHRKPGRFDIIGDAVREIQGVSAVERHRAVADPDPPDGGREGAPLPFGSPHRRGHGQR